MYMATKRAQTVAPRKPFRWTRAHLAYFPDDGNRYEVLDGQLFVTPQASVPHQWISNALITALREYCTTHGLGVPLGPGAVVFEDNELQPDVLVVPKLTGPVPEKWEELPLPHLVVEVLSRTTRRRDLVLKREAYLTLGIKGYWVVDRFERCAHIWTQGSDEPQVITDIIRWQPLSAIPALEIPLARVFDSLAAPQDD